jgi:hypothetical protein
MQEAAPHTIDLWDTSTSCHSLSIGINFFLLFSNQALGVDFGFFITVTFFKARAAR